MSVHAAKLYTPADIATGIMADMRRGPQCEVCYQPIKRVPGGQGPCWVHSDSGAVAAADPPFRPELVPAVETVQSQVVANVLSTVVDGVQFNGVDGSVWILAPESFYVVRVDAMGSTYSAYLISGQPDSADISGWATGWEAPSS